VPCGAPVPLAIPVPLARAGAVPFGSSFALPSFGPRSGSERVRLLACWGRLQY
jgi:hypothetical protein